MGSSTLNTASTTRDWLSLPDEIWATIGDHLSVDRFDTTRFRSVCNSWRSLIPKFDQSVSAPLPRFSFSLRPYSGIMAFVSDSTVYRIDLSSAAAGDSGRRSWLVKVESSGGDKLRLMDPLSCRRIKDVEHSLADSRPLRLEEFRLSAVARTFALRYVRGSSSIGGVNKLVLNPGDPSSVFVIYENGKLGFARDGDSEITLVDSRIVDYSDVVVHRGQPYVVDRWGTVSWIDSWLKLVQFSPPIGLGGTKHLVVSSGELYVVDRFVDEAGAAAQYEESLRLGFNAFLRHPLRRRRFEQLHLHPRSVDFKVFKLDEEWGRWAEVKSLGESSFVLSYDGSFAVNATEFDGFEANCIYFTEQFDMDYALRRLGRQGGCVFRLEDGTVEDLEITPGYFNLFSSSALPDQ